MAHRNKSYKEGYVPGVERPITPTEFDPNAGTPVDPIERPVVVRSSSQLRYQDLDPLTTAADGQLLSNDSFDVDPISGANACLYVNGQAFYPADGEDEVSTSSFYITSSGGTVRTQGTFAAGDLLYWNQSVAGFNIEAEDILKLAYEV